MHEAALELSRASILTLAPAAGQPPKLQCWRKIGVRVRFLELLALSVDDVAALVAFVAGPEASYITGANLTVDGGTNA